MVASAFAFSIMSLFVKLAGERLPAQEIVFARAAISLVLSWYWLRLQGVPMWGRRRGLLVLRGLVGFCGLTCFYYAITRLPLAEVTVIQYLHPVLTAVLAAVLLGERPGAVLPVSLLLSTAGVLLITKPAVLFGGQVALSWLPTVSALGGAVFSAIAYTLVRQLSRTEPPLVIVFYFPLVAVPASVPLLLQDPVWPRGVDWLLLLGVGVSTQIAQVELTKGLTLEPAGRATAMAYLQVVFAAAWGALVFGDLPDALTIVGAGAVLAGSLLVALRR